jgi:hypothetical protein
MGAVVVMKSSVAALRGVVEGPEDVSFAHAVARHSLKKPSGSFLGAVFNPPLAEEAA